VLGVLARPYVPDGVAYLLLGAVIYANGFVAAFNLLPGLPLDGGFLVDSLVWRITGKRESGLIAAGWSGRVVTVLVVLAFVGWPLVNGRPPDLFNLVWAFFIGAFLWAGATNAIRTGRGSRLLAGIPIGSVWRPAASLPANASAAQGLALRNSRPGGTAVVVQDELGNAVGLLDDEALRAIPEQALGDVSVVSVMRQQPDGWVVEATPDQSIATVVMTMQHLGIGVVPVRGPDGRIGGIILAADLETALSQRPAPRT
jgi:CBS domain-containing protein